MEPSFVEIGKKLTDGAISAMSNWLLWLFLVLVIIGLFRNAFSFGLDATDKDGWNRSGLKLLIDNQTGVHYLSDGKGGLHLRVDSSGKPVSNK